jgi:hypothetical protein
MKEISVEDYFTICEKTNILKAISVFIEDRWLEFMTNVVTCSMDMSSNNFDVYLTVSGDHNLVNKINIGETVVNINGNKIACKIVNVFSERNLMFVIHISYSYFQCMQTDISNTFNTMQNEISHNIIDVEKLYDVYLSEKKDKFFCNIDLD